MGFLHFEKGFQVWQKIASKQDLCGVGCLAEKRGDSVDLKTKFFGDVNYLRSQKMNSDCSKAIRLITESFSKTKAEVACDNENGYYAVFVIAGKGKINLAQKALTALSR